MPVPSTLAGPLAEANGSASLSGVKLAGLVIGLLLVVAAIRAMFGKHKR